MRRPQAWVSVTRVSSSDPRVDPIARARGLTKTYGQGDTFVVALDGVDIDIDPGTFTAIMGPSGSGKSTLMHCLAGLDSVTAGDVYIGETLVTGLSDRLLTRVRRDSVGFIFQSFNLVPTLTARENITLPMDIAGRAPDADWLASIVEAVGLSDRLDHRPSELSGGQQQRVACARALASRPSIIFADEPTGNLDSQAGAEVLSLLRRSADSFGQTIVMVTHDASAASYADRVVFLADGRVVGELAAPTTETVLARIAALSVRSEG